MKKITLFLLSFLFVSQIAKSQNTCLNASNLFTTTVAIPPIGTVSPVGPDLGCLSTTQRQVWYYIPICKTTTNLLLEVDFGIGNNNTNGMVLYGPFSQKVTNCLDLAANKIIGCSESIPLNWNHVSANDTLIEGNYCYLLLTFSDSISYYIINPGFGFYQSCFECNNQVSVLNENNLCLVSVDTAINKCTLTWEEFPATNLAGYVIKRESTFTGVYDSLTTVPVGSLSTYTDLTSSPVQHNYTYAVSAVDSCDQYYPVSWQTSLSSIHLISFSGGNNQAQLIWNNIFAPASFIPQYYIYRNSNNTGWQLIDSIGITLPTITYTDIFAPAGVNLYTVELRKLNPCIPMRVANSTTAYQSAFSNVSIANVTAGAEELTNSGRISIYPNPAKDKFTIDLNYLTMGTVDVSISNMQGIKCLDQKNVSEKTLTIETKNWKPGVYMVEIKGDKVYRSKLVIQ